jgi:hypothetical protein
MVRTVREKVKAGLPENQVAELVSRSRGLPIVRAVVGSPVWCRRRRRRYCRIHPCLETVEREVSVFLLG